MVPNGFLSTPSARRATFTLPDDRAYWDISIHALREEGDLPKYASLTPSFGFLSTPSARRATVGNSVPVYRVQRISIHALREEGDGSDPIRSTSA